MEETLRQYLMQLLPSKADWVNELEQSAHDDGIPIMDPLSMHFVMQLIQLKKPERILEIGTAYGYSALRMLQANPEASIVTIEKDEQHYNQAIRYIRDRDAQDRIRVICGDALDELPVMSRQLFDMVLIDAAKGQYQRFFELAAPLLREGGFILTDNVLFKGYVADLEKPGERYQRIAQKIRSYNDWLMKHPDFTTSVMPVGDGIAISQKTERKEPSSHA